MHIMCYVQEVAADTQRSFGFWSGCQSVLVPAVPPSVRCSCLHFLITPASGSIVPHHQQRAAVNVSQQVVLQKA